MSRLLNPPSDSLRASKLELPSQNLQVKTSKLKSMVNKMSY